MFVSREATPCDGHLRAPCNGRSPGPVFGWGKNLRNRRKVGSLTLKAASSESSSHPSVEVLDLQSSLLKDLFPTAALGTFSNRDGTSEARALLVAFFERETNRTEAAAREKEKCFRELEARVHRLAAEMQHEVAGLPLGEEARLRMKKWTDPENELNYKSLAVLVSNAMFLVGLPYLGGSFDLDIEDFLDLAAEFQRLCGPVAYHYIFPDFVASLIFVPFSRAVRKGELVIDKASRTSLLRMWVHVECVEAFRGLVPQVEVDAESAALLSTFSRGEQSSFLEQWMPSLLKRRGGWALWFKAWLEEVSLTTAQPVSGSVLQET
jgi:hypothetical protein